MTTKRPFWTTVPSTSSTLWPPAHVESAEVSSIMNDTSRWGQYVWDTTGNALRAYAVIGSMETAAILVLNVALCALILSSPSLRARLRNRMLVSLALAHLLVGLYSAPLGVDLALKVRWGEVGCLAELTRRWLTEYVQHLVASWGVALLLLHYAARLARWEAPAPALAWLPLRYPPGLSRLAGLLYVLFPWLLAASVAAPLLAAGRLAGVADWLLQGFRPCSVHLAAGTRIALKVLSCYLPDLVIVVVLVALTVWVKQGRASWLAASAEKEEEAETKKKKKKKEPGPEAAVAAERAPDAESQRKVEAGTAGLVTSAADDDLDVDPALAHLLVGAATVGLLLPHHLLSLILLSHGALLPRELGWLKLSVALQVVEGLLPVLAPALWLTLLPDLAQRRRELLGRLQERLADCSAATGRWRRSPPVEEANEVPPVSFKYLDDE